MSSMDDVGGVTGRWVSTEGVSHDMLVFAFNLVESVRERQHGLDPSGLAVVERGVMSCLA